MKTIIITSRRGCYTYNIGVHTVCGPDQDGDLVMYNQGDTDPLFLAKAGGRDRTRALFKALAERALFMAYNNKALTVLDITSYTAPE